MYTDAHIAQILVIFVCVQLSCFRRDSWLYLENSHLMWEKKNILVWALRLGSSIMKIHWCY